MGPSTSSSAVSATRVSRSPTVHSPCLSESSREARSSKRAKSTPLASASCSASPTVPRPCLARSKGSSYQYARFPADFGQGQATRDDVVETPGHALQPHERGLQERRREISVPLLSQTLSHFSLSPSFSAPIMAHSSLDAGSNRTPPTKPSGYSKSPRSAQTPLRSPRRRTRQTRTPSALQKDHVYPSTAPLPHINAFLGSPFSTKTTRDGFQYNSTSPCQRVRTERIGQGNIERMEFNRFNYEQPSPVAPLQEDEDLAAKFSSLSNRAHSRRDTFSSSSSIDDFSGSGTSSASLLSLGRKSDELHHAYCPVTVWGEDGLGGRIEEETDPATPSRTCFIGDALEVSAKTARVTPGVTPIVFRPYPSSSPNILTGDVKADWSTKLGGVDPLHVPSPIPGRSRSPAARSIPRLPSSVLKQRSGSKYERHRSPRQPLFSPDQESIRPASQRQATAKSSTLIESRNTNGDEGPAFALGLGLGIYAADRSLYPCVDRPSAEGVNLSCSFSSESSADFDHSPSKTSSARITSAHSATIPFILPIQSIDHPDEDKKPEPSRRRTLSGQSSSSSTGSGQSQPSINLWNERPTLRRGITAPSITAIPSYLAPQAALHTPPPAMFADIKPSPAAFASTGLIKKTSGLAKAKVFSFAVQGEPSAAIARGWFAAVSPLSPVKPNGMASGMVSSTSTSSSTRAASIGMDRNSPESTRPSQRVRGLRRKGSQMFISSASSGSVNDRQECLASPATPTKSGPTNNLNDYSTPSPSTPADSVYPFTAGSSLSSSSPPSAGDASSRLRQGLPARLLGHRGPIVRTSNPMLATAYLMHNSAIESARASGDSESRPGKPASRGRFEDDFQIIRSLGIGAFSQVWKVCEKKTGSLYAVKAGKPFTGFKNRLRQLEEVSILRQLSVIHHPHIVNFIDSWEHRGRLYIQTELVDCGDLARFLQSVGDIGGIGEPRAWKMLAELSAGIQYIHAHDFLHLDIKPSNVLITQVGSLKIADFGLSIVAAPGGTAGSLSPALPHVQEDGGFVWEPQENSVPIPSPILDRDLEGDRAYLCPEVLSNGQVGGEADVYSLGILLLESALNVELPSNGDGWIKLRNEDWSDLAEHYRLLDRRSTGSSEGDVIAPELSGELLLFIKSLMRREPEQRMKLDDLEKTAVMVRLRAVQSIREGVRMPNAALVKEGDWFLPYILGEEVA